MDIVALAEITDDVADLVGGKALGLAALVRAGERVPDGFCLTTRVHDVGEVPEEALAAAHARLGGGPVAVRSSATAEDLPHASFAGQQETLLNVTGPELPGAVRSVWESLHTERATAYREANGIEHASVRMAVVVQRMVDARAAGVMFTANPVTGSRAETVVDAAPGPGSAVVDGGVVPDHYVLRRNAEDGVPEGGGCLDRGSLAALAHVGARLQDLFGSPQDVEWALDREGALWLLQSRPVTTLFPAPPDTGDDQPRVYLEFGHVQGMLRPFTPMGMSVLRTALADMGASLGGGVRRGSAGGGIVTDIGGRLYADLTALVRDPSVRDRLPGFMAVDFGPRAQAAVERVMADPRFAPVRHRVPGRTRRTLRTVLRVLPRAVGGVARSLLRPQEARARVRRSIDRFRNAEAAGAARPMTAAERLDLVAHPGRSLGSVDGLLWPVVTGVLASAIPAALFRGIASEAETNTVLGGLPHNVTTEMDLALWRVSERAAAHRELLRDTPPEDLASAYAAGTLPDVGLADFLRDYGHRSAAEVDVGVPRWDEDPAPLFAVLANYLRLDDPEQAPDRRFARAADRAEATLEEVLRRTRRRKPVRGRIAKPLMRRVRALAGLREAGKFGGLYPLRGMRRHLLLVGAELRDSGLLERADDVMFLTLPEAGAAVADGADHRDLVRTRRLHHERELRRRHVPVALLADGTDAEAMDTAAPGTAEEEPGVLRGTAASAGRATGRARVVHDPADARIEPGEILVAATTDPGWTPLFLTAGGLVTETGAAMAHGPTVAREYGIPAVICVRDATHRIRTGQVVTVDGATGTVTVEG